jgi:uncharacterized membrane protein
MSVNLNVFALLITALVTLNLGLTGLAPRSDQGTEHPAQQVRSAIHDSSGSQSGTTGVGAGAARVYVLKPWRALRTHLHNKIIHVPIGFALSGFLLSLIALRWKEVEPAIRWLVLVAAIGSLCAYLTGTNQAALLEGGSKDWIIQLHQKLGIATAILLWVWTVTCWIRRFSTWSLVIGGVAVTLLTLTGFFGGVIAHG